MPIVFEIPNKITRLVFKVDEFCWKNIPLDVIKTLEKEFIPFCFQEAKKNIKVYDKQNKQCFTPTYIF